MDMVYVMIRWARVCGYAIKTQWADRGRRLPILYVCVKELCVKGPISSG
jgi:hypothetical protein